MTDPNRSRDELWVCHLGAVRYRDALAVQRELCARRQAEELPDTLLLLEHPPVYTRGRRSEAEDLPLGEEFYRAKGIDVEASDRGGSSPTTVSASWSAIRSCVSATCTATCAPWKTRSSSRSLAPA